MSNIFLLNQGEWFYRHKLKPFAKLSGRMLRLFKHCEIPYTAKIARDVVFAHKGLGVVIGHDAVIGSGTKILQHVTIGGRGGVRGCPVIGKNVLIGANALVLGKITVGDNAKIGAGAVVLHDVPANCTVVGNPARIVKTETPPETETGAAAKEGSAGAANE